MLIDKGKKKPVYTGVFGANIELAKAFTEEVKQTGVVFDIPLSLIDKPPFHDRTSWAQSDIDELSNSISNVGLLEPIVVRKLDNGRYQRLAGFMRIKAHEKLNKKIISATVLENISDADAYLIMISENTHRKQPNAYDEVKSIVEYLAIGVQMEKADLISFLRRAENNKKGSIKHFSFDEEETLNRLEVMLGRLGRFTLGSFVKNRLSVLSMSQSIIDALVSGKIDYSKARAIHQLKDYPEEIDMLIKRIINNDLSLKDIKSQVVNFLVSKKNSMTAKNKKQSEKQKTLAFVNIGKTVKKSYSSLDESSKKELDELFSKIEKIISVKG
ncbi:MAG: ParB/RepB/Spo0J family partition protein [Campylobacterales bacterium]|nr:ParB/RepB/Spo0J family partition protein [Campylobacterales bacterium]